MMMITGRRLVHFGKIADISSYRSLSTSTTLNFVSTPSLPENAIGSHRHNTPVSTARRSNRALAATVTAHPAGGLRTFFSQLLAGGEQFLLSRTFRNQNPREGTAQLCQR